ncbi:hypothetical protein, conserved [Babesia bigemina]|uniref:Uncharacterized protein n=1 Tax=Babesia bigemina TaxID=5866 RepID=A0A061BJY2_BABBI|nr:hypothetical protein, conserved [Babesia bigemina]CDR71767.1 hypothetical protein, conserved [Babesia bigemina]|eukprot:XP_012770711.1 hypothetical protein, conserved [Babesia bigemina]
MEVRYDSSAYPQGSNMAYDLGSILSKNGHNFFRDIFSTTVVSDSGKDKVNIANALHLVDVFCHIVAEEAKKNDGGELIETLNEDLRKTTKHSNTPIYWQYLKEHCAGLQSQLDKLFADGAFSQTGQSPKVSMLKTKEFAERTAQWLRENLKNVKNHLQNCVISIGDIDGRNTRKLGEHFTKNVFAYGFIFGFNPNGSHRMNAADLLKIWGSVIDTLKQKADGLEKLEEILNGKLPAPPPPEPVSPQPNQTEATNPVVVIAPGAQRQDKQGEGPQDRSSAPSAATFSDSQLGNSDSLSTSVVKGDADTARPKGDPGTPGPGGPQPQDNSRSQAQRIVQPQKPIQSQLAPSSSVFPHSAAGLAVDPGKGSVGGVPSGQQRAASQSPSRIQPTGVQRADHTSHGVPDAGSEVRLGGQASSSQFSQHNGIASPTDTNFVSSLNSGFVSSSGGGGVNGIGDPTSGSNATHNQRIKVPNNMIPDRCAGGIHVRDNDTSYCQTKGVAVKARDWQTKWERAENQKWIDDKRKQQEALNQAALQRDFQNSIEIQTKSIREHPSRRSYPHAPRVAAELKKRNSKGDPQALSVRKHRDNVQVGEATGHAASGASGIPRSMRTPIIHVLGHALKRPDVKSAESIRPLIHHKFMTRTLPSDPIVKLPKKLNRAIAKRVIQPIKVLFDKPPPMSLPHIPRRIRLSKSFLEFPPPSLTPVDFDDHPAAAVIPSVCPVKYANTAVDKLPPTDTSRPSPRTVREMLCWLGDLPNAPSYEELIKHIMYVFGKSKSIDAIPESFSTEDVTEALSQTCGHASSVLAGIHGSGPDVSKSHYERYGAPLMYYSDDPHTLLCQVLSYVYATCHQLSFLRTQCRRGRDSGGWSDCQFGKGVKSSETWQCTEHPLGFKKSNHRGCNPSPLQGFLTDCSVLPTYWYDRDNTCRVSHIKMGFNSAHFPMKAKNGFYIYSFLIGPCYNNVDPLEKLCRYLICLTRRTPRTTGELLSFFHNFGSELHKHVTGSLSDLGIALTNAPKLFPKWEHLGKSDLKALQDIGGSDSSNHGHVKTLSTLVGCEIKPVNCPKLCWPIMHRPYAVYSPCLAQTYLSWVVYLADTLRESLDRLRYDFTRHKVSKCGSIHHCHDALPYLYFHGFTPPEGTSTSLVTCSQVITKLEEVINGGPIAKLITCMDKFLYRVRGPFIFLSLALWPTAFLLFAHTALYRLDVLRIQSHFMRSRGSHVIDVKALLTDGTKMPSLYDIDYFDDEALAHAWNRIY